MNKFKVLGFTVLGCGALLLTGCGGGGSSAHTLNCSIEEDGQSMKVEVKFNDEETAAEKVTMEMSVTIPDGTSDEEIEAAKQMFESSCAAGTYDKCDVSVSGGKLKVTMVGKAEDMDFAKGTLEETKKSAEDAGYTCK